MKLAIEKQVAATVPKKISKQVEEDFDLFHEFEHQSDLKFTLTIDCMVHKIFIQIYYT